MRREKLKGEKGEGRRWWTEDLKKMKLWECELHFLKRGTLVYIGKKVTAPNGHYPRSSSHWWRDSRFQRHSFFNLRKSSKSCGTIEGGEGNVSFSNLESFSASLYFVISSNRSIERLGFFISVFLFYLHLCFSVYFAKLILFTTIIAQTISL